MEDSLKCSVLSKGDFSKPQEKPSKDDNVKISDSGFLPLLGLKDYKDVLRSGKESLLQEK